jgi:hypothetical protein
MTLFTYRRLLLRYLRPICAITIHPILPIYFPKMIATACCQSLRITRQTMQIVNVNLCKLSVRHTEVFQARHFSNASDVSFVPFIRINHTMGVKSANRNARPSQVPPTDQISSTPSNKRLPLSESKKRALKDQATHQAEKQQSVKKTKSGTPSSSTDKTTSTQSSIAKTISEENDTVVTTDTQDKVKKYMSRDIQCSGWTLVIVTYNRKPWTIVITTYD